MTAVSASRETLNNSSLPAFLYKCDAMSLQQGIQLFKTDGFQGFQKKKQQKTRDQRLTTTVQRAFEIKNRFSISLIECDLVTVERSKSCDTISFVKLNYATPSDVQLTLDALYYVHFCSTIPVQTLLNILTPISLTLTY